MYQYQFEQCSSFSVVSYLLRFNISNIMLPDTLPVLLNVLKCPSSLPLLPAIALTPAHCETLCTKPTTIEKKKTNESGLAKSTRMKKFYQCADCYVGTLIIY